MDTKKIIEAYVDKEQSIQQIAAEYNTYPNKIRRKLVKAGVKMRDKSEAQKLALAKGVSVHPTEGKGHSDKTKLKISEKSAEVWANLSSKELEERKDVLRESFLSRPKKDREAMQRKAASAVSESSRNGSKVELFLLEELPKNGYNILFHKKGLVANTELEPDLAIPNLRTVIEIDGPAHFFPIWGQEALDKRIKSDNEKNGLFLAKGWHVLRIKHLCKTFTAKKQRTLLAEVIKELKKIEQLTSPQIIEVTV
jgi:very-short-patch-repair endonuclease